MPGNPVSFRDLKKLAFRFAIIALALAVTDVRADRRPPVKIRMPADTPVAGKGQPLSATFEIVIARPGILDEARIDGRGWTVSAISRPVLPLVADAGTLIIPFQATPEDPDQPITLTIRFEGQLISRTLRLGPKAAAQREKDHPALQIPPQHPTPEDSSRNFSVAGDAMPLRFTGRIVYDRPVMLDDDNNPAGGTVPVGVDFMWVEVIDEDDISTETIWSGFTDVNGYFDSGVIQWDDCDPVCDDPDIYVRWECDNYIVNVQDANDVLEEDWSWSTEDQTHDDFTGSGIDFGTLKPADGGQMPILHIHNSIIRAHRWIQYESGSGISTNEVDVQWPEDEAGSGAYHIGFFDELYISPSRQWHEDTHTHEYGHHFLDEYAVNDGTDYCNGICDEDDDCGHCRWCAETSLDAWNEGWPNWLADIVTRDYPGSYTFSDGTPYTPLKTRSHENVDTCQEDDQFHDVLTTEGFLGAMLRDIDDVDPDPVPVTVGDYNVVERQDCIALGPDEIFHITTEYEPTTPQGFLSTFLLVYPQHMARLFPTLSNISSDFESFFPPDTQPPGIVQQVWSPSHPFGDGGPLPCMVLEWDTPPDDVTGGRTYSINWGTDPAGQEPDEKVDIFGSCVTLTLGPEALGNHYISIKARDFTGAWSNGWDVFGPFAVTDCNSNGITDLCEVSCIPDVDYDDLTCTVGPFFCEAQADCGFAPDCQPNKVPDDCDVASGASSDCNENGVPDECESISHWDLISGVWSDSESWREKVLPANGNHICIGVFPDEITATLDKGAYDVAILACDENLTIATAGSPAAQLTLSEPSRIRGNLTLRNNGSVLRPNDRLDIEGLVTWTGSNVTSSARFAGSGETWLHGGMVVTDGVVHLDSHDLYLEGMSFVQGGGRIDYLNDANITIRPGATLEYQSSSFGVSGGFTGSFVNLGTLRKTQSANDMHISVLTQNDGLIHVLAGTFQLSRQSTSTGDFVAEPGTVLEFVGGGHELLASSSIVAETVRFPGGIAGSNNIRGTYNVSDSTVITTTTTFTTEANVINYGTNLTSGNAIFDTMIGAPIHFDTLTGGTLRFNSGDHVIVETLNLQSGGQFIGPGPLTVNGTINWSAGGSFRGSGEIHSNGQLNIGAGGSQKSLEGRTLNIAGTATFNGPFGLINTAVVNNLSTGHMDIRIDGTAMSSESPFFNNAGTLVKSAGAGTTTISPNTTNTGMIEVQTGLLQFRRLTQTDGEVFLNGGNFGMTQASTPQPFQLQGGLLRGQGSLTGVVNNTGGTISPGASAGMLTFSGNYTQGAGGSLRIEIAGIAPGQFDVLQVNATASLGGTLQVETQYSPAVDDSFIVLIANSISGEFDFIVRDQPLGIRYEPTQVVVEYLVSNADLDMDGDVDMFDQSLFQRCFAAGAVASPSDCPAGPLADLDGNGIVDLIDHAEVFVPAMAGPLN